MPHEGGAVNEQAVLDEDAAFELIVIAYDVAMESNDTVVLHTALDEIEQILNRPGLGHMRADADVIEYKALIAEETRRIKQLRAIANDPRWRIRPDDCIRILPRSRLAA
jgi:hypothetical protein